MPFHDSDSETQIIFGEADITGSSSNKAAVLMAGVTPSNTGSFLKVTEDGELIVSGAFSADVSIAQVDQGNAGTQNEGWYARLTDGTQVLGTGSSAPLYTSGSVFVENFPSVQTVTGSVGITQAPPLTIGSFNTTASISIEEANVIFDVTGTVGVTSIASPVTIGNFPAVQTITGSVVLGEQPIQTTGTLGVTELPNVTIDSFITTASVSIAETLITQSVVGDVSVNNFPAVQTITGSVSLDEQPIQITGSVSLSEIADITGSVGITSIASPVTVTGSVVLGEEPIETTGSVTVNSVGSPVEVEQGNAGTQSEGWYTRITDGSKVLGTGSSAPIFTSGSVHVQNFPPVQTITGSVIIGEQPINATGSVTVNSVGAPIKQGIAGTQDEGWFVRITDGVQVLGTGSAAPFYISGTVGVTSVGSPIKQGLSGSTAWKVTLRDEFDRFIGSGSNPVITKPQRYFTTTFGRIRTGDPFTQADYVNTYGIDLFEWASSSQGGGTITSVTSQSAFRLSVGASSGDSARIRTNTNYRYQAGKTQIIKMTTYQDTPNSTNQVRRWGVFDDNNGLFFSVSGSQFGFYTRSNGIGGKVVDSFVSQSDWNVDKYDGTGPSKQILDLGTVNIYEIHYNWLGTGTTAWFLNGDIVHEEINANRFHGPYMGTGILPLSCEVQNDGASSSGQMVTICSSVETEGGQPPPAYSFAAQNNVDINVGTTVEVPLLAIRPGLSFRGLYNKVITLPKRLTISTEGARISYKIILDPTITGGSWVSASNNNSSVEYNRTPVSASGGETIFQGFLPAAEDAAVVDLQEFFDYNARKLLRRAFSTTTETLLVVAKNEKAGTTLVRAGFTWNEVR